MKQATSPKFDRYGMPITRPGLVPMPPVKQPRKVGASSADALSKANYLADVLAPNLKGEARRKWVAIAQRIIGES